MKRRSFVQSSGMLGMGVLAVPQFHIGNSKPKLDPEIIGHGEHTYRIHKDWGTQDLAKVPIQNCHEMVMDSNGRLIMLGDHVQNNVLVYDQSGALLETWGTQYPGGHGLTLSREGEEDFLFIADCGFFTDKNGKGARQSGHVVKTTVDGKLVFSVGHPKTIGIYDEGDPYQPTEIAVAPNGDFYIADGYGSQYIIQYNHQGEYIRHFGGRNNNYAQYNLSTAHGVCVDTRDPSNPVLVVTSRGENAFKIFTLEGKFVKTIKIPGAYVCRAVIKGDHLYAGVCWSKIDGQRAANTGFVTILDKNYLVVSNPGGTQPEYVDGKLKPVRNEGNHFYHGHDVCIDNDENIYVCQWNAQQTYPVKLERV